MVLPFNILEWVRENRHLLRPPVGNKQLFKGDNFIVMAVAGPNSRNDFHYNETEEFFYQLEGKITLRLQLPEGLKEVVMGPGDIFLLPAGIPHSPQRPADTVGLVIEAGRKEGQRDGLLWFCSRCNHKLFEKYFVLNSIEQDFLPVIAEFNSSAALRTCPSCGFVVPPAG